MVVGQYLLFQINVLLSAWDSLEEMDLWDLLPILSRLRPYMVSRFLSFYSCLPFIFFFFSFRLLPLARDLCRAQMRKQAYYIFPF